MNYAILRVQKLKSEVGIRRSLKHAFREQKTPNADPLRTPENTHIGATSCAEAMKAVRTRLPEKRRKNAVLVIEYLITASPEVMHAKSRKQQDAYFSDALRWLQARHGSDNVVYAGIHRDEITPHMYAYVVPFDPAGKLNCRHFLGGAKALSEMQTDFALTVGEKHALERGVKGSKATHQRVKRHYTAVNEPAPELLDIKVPEPTFTERLKPADYVERVKSSVLKQVAPRLESEQAKAKELEQVKARSAEKDRALKQHQKRYGAFLEVIDALALMNGGKRALDELQGVREALEAQKKAQQEAEQETARKSRELLQKVSDNMCLADPTLHWYEAERRAEELAMDGRYEELQEWVDWEPVEPEPPVSMPSREKQPEVIRRPRDEGPDLGF